MAEKQKLIDKKILKKSLNAMFELLVKNFLNKLILNLWNIFEFKLIKFTSLIQQQQQLRNKIKTIRIKI